ncbi:MAG TPA: flavin reductase family protein [bacterium]|nr:flavin reductase family protein [bacterium]
MTKVALPGRPLGPFPTVLVGAMVDGKPNYATVGACSIVGLEPVLSVSLKATHHTTKGIVAGGHFSVNIPSAAMVDKVDFCGIHSGAKVDKTALFTTFQDEAALAPMIRECPVNYVCRVVRTIEVTGFKLFFGEIVSMQVDAACLTDGQIDPAKVQPMVMFGLSYLALGANVGTAFRSGRALPAQPVA